MANTVHENVDQVLNTTQDMARDRFEDAKSYADSWFGKLESFLRGLEAKLGDLKPAAVSTNVHTFDPVVISVEDDTGLMEDMQDDLNRIDSIVDDIESERKPTPPTLIIPDLDDYADIGDIDDIKAQLLPMLNSLIALMADLRNDLAAINFDDTYTSDLLDALKARILVLIQDGGAGFDEEIATRELQRDIQARQDAIADALSQSAGNGFSLPSGFLLANVRQIEVEWQNKRLETMNALAVKEMEIRHRTMELAIQGGIEIEKALMDYEAKIKALVLEAKKLIAQLAIDAVKVISEVLDAYVKVFQAQVAAFDAAVKGEMAKGELYATQAKIYATTVDAYIKQIDAIKEKIAAEVEILKADTELAKLEGDLTLKVLDFSQRNTLASEEAALKAHEIALADGFRTLQASVEIKRGIVAALSQLVAAALTSIHVAAHLSASGSAQENFSSSESVSTSTQHTYNH